MQVNLFLLFFVIFLYTDGQWDIFHHRVPTSKKTFHCKFNMLVDGNNVNLKKSKVTCRPRQPKLQKVQELKIDGELGSYLLSLSINPSNIKKAEFSPKTPPKPKTCDYGYTRVCPPNSSQGCGEGMYNYCPNGEDNVKAESQTGQNCSCLSGYLVTEAVSSGVSPLGCGKGCVCLSEDFRQCDNTTIANTTTTTTTMTTTTTTTTPSATTTTGSYLYLGSTQILDMNTFKEVPCDQQFTTGTYGSTAGFVSYNNTRELMVCGGYHQSGCHIWTNNGWVQSDTTYHRHWHSNGASETSAGWLVTGGLDMREIVGKRKQKSCSLYTNGKWQNFTELPVPIIAHCQVTINDTVYIVGGNTYHTLHTTENYKLTSGSNRWSKISSLNQQRNSHACVEWDGGILVIGGYAYYVHHLSSVEWYDLDKNKWSVFNKLPMKLAGHQAVVWEGDLYVLGGWDKTNNVINNVVYKLKKGSTTWEVVPGVNVEVIRNNALFRAVLTNKIHCKT